MFGKRFDLAILKDKNDNLAKELENLKTQYAALKTTLDNLNAEVANASVGFDFNKVDVFSVERMVSDNKPCTVIGYHVKKQEYVSSNNSIAENLELQQWYLYCSAEWHEKLVKQFEASRK
jgi:translation initiation factor IF-2